MAYHLDLSRISLQSYKELLKNQNLLPGRRILWENIDHNFKMIENCGIENILQLKKALSAPQKLASFAAGCGVSEDYLTILKREAGTLEQKPVLIADFPDVDPSRISALNEAGIKTSKEYFESKPSGADALLCLCDLVRINGVGAVAARAFFEAGYQCVPDVAHADAAEMLKKVTDVNKARQYYRANLGLKDMQFCIDFAALLVRFGD